MDINQKIFSIIEPLLEKEGYEVIEVDYHRKSARKMGIFVAIDRLDEENITIEDCTKATRAMEEKLADEIEADYILEVSSPGLDRVLTKPRHFERFTGSFAEIKLKTPLEEDRLKYTGIIESTEDEGFFLKADDNPTPIHIKYSNIQKAKLKYKRH